MKIDQDLCTFKPITLTFETHAELKQFVDEVGSTTSDKIIPYIVWNELYKKLYGSAKP
jgi:hypothetical protein